MSGYLDDEPRDRHALSCPIWASDDPADDCDCLDGFEAGVQARLDRFESYAVGGGT